MKDQERLLVSGLVAVLVLVWLGFTVHVSPRFAGSLMGGVLAIIGTTLMLIPFMYLCIKRIAWLKRLVTKRVSMVRLLEIHIYAGVLGPLLVIVHSGHKFSSPLGITLTALTILIVLSGFTGRYLMRNEGQEITEKQGWLTELMTEFQRTHYELKQRTPIPSNTLVRAESSRSLFSWLLFTDLPEKDETTRLEARALSLSESIADVEYAIRTHETFKFAFSVWLKFHIVLSLNLYFLIGLHVWAGIHFGLRWVQ